MGILGFRVSFVGFQVWGFGGLRRDSIEDSMGLLGLHRIVWGLFEVHE